MKTAKFFFSLLIASVLLSTVACSSDDTISVCIFFAVFDFHNE